MTSASIVSQAAIENETDDAELRAQKIQDNIGKGDEDTYTFHWQEKIFSQVTFPLKLTCFLNVIIYV